MTMIQVTSARLKNTAQELQNLISRFQNMSAELDQREQALCTMWEGKAKEAFHRAYIRDREQVEVFAKLIAQYARILQEIGERYEQAELKNAQIASKRSY
ncbi:MAG: WXG100 family type VII secretion target [Lachnospiraceae bacterium]|nr:WXG100 family type VII secretion target [Lachnospiraceae bacterium]